MTNEVKAKEIAEKTHTVWRDEDGEDISSQDDCYEAAMKMANWKDEEIKKLKKEIADGEKFREELKRLCNERLDDRIALENELEEYKDATLINSMPISKLGGWHTEPPTKDCTVLLYITEQTLTVSTWNSPNNMFYDTEYKPIKKWTKWKKI